MKPSQLLSSEQKWTKRVLARNKNGRSVDVNNKNAYSFCLVGAVAKCFSEGDIGYYRAIDKLEKIIFNETGNWTVPAFNDNKNTTFTDIKKILKKAKL